MSEVVVPQWGQPVLPRTHALLAQTLVARYGIAYPSDTEIMDLVSDLAVQGVWLQEVGSPDQTMVAPTNTTETSRAAASHPEHILEWGAQRALVLGILVNDGPKTCADVHSYAEINGSRNQVAGRFVELRRMGFVTWMLNEDGSHVLRPTGPTSKGRVQMATPLGEIRYRVLQGENP